MINKNLKTMTKSALNEFRRAITSFTKFRKEETYSAEIFVGLGDTPLTITDVEDACQDYVDKVGLCVYISQGRYVYTGGAEDGFCVHLMRYPRYPSSNKEVRDNAVAMASMLMNKLEQDKVSIKMPDDTFTLFA